MSAVLDRCPPEAVTDPWLAAIRYRAIGRAAGDLREQAPVVAGHVSELAGLGLTPVDCWYLGGLDQFLGPYPGDAGVTP